MLILLPPSEGKTAPSRGKAMDPESWPAGLAEPRARVLDALVGLCAGDPNQAAEVLGLGPSLAGEVRRNAALREEPTRRADEVYTGVLYEALDPRTLSTAARRRAGRRVNVTSALFGLVAPQERIPAYRLSADVPLPGLGRVSAYWRRHLGPIIERRVGDGLLVDLRSSGYAAFWRPPPTGRVATVRVLHERDGSLSVVSHFNKATKGRMVRALLEDGGTPGTPGELAAMLGDLGWAVRREGPRLDVVVADL